MFYSLGPREPTLGALQERRSGEERREQKRKTLMQRTAGEQGLEMPWASVQALGPPWQPTCDAVHTPIGTACKVLASKIGVP